LGGNPLFSFAGFLKSSSYISGSTGSTIFGHDGANGLIEIQGLSSSSIPGGLLINYNCHRNVAICTGNSINPAENKVFIGDFINMRKHVEIGSLTSINDPANTSLDIFTNAGKGIKFTTYNNGLPLISVDNSNFTYSPINIFGAGNIELNTSGTNKMFVIKDPTAASTVQEKFVVSGNGRTNIGVGRPNASAGVVANSMLTVDGGILCREVFVAISNTYWADYVFNKGYKLMPLTDVKKYIQQNNHLPGVDSGTQLAEKGLAITEMQKTQMEKIEELYLYVIKLNEEMEALKKQNNELLKKLNK